MTETLIKRRNAIGRSYLAKINPVVNPALDGKGTLVFRNAAVDANLVSLAFVSYQATWYQFDNLTGENVPLGDSRSSTLPTMQAPAALPTDAGTFVRVDIRASSAGHSSWNIPVRTYFRCTATGWKLAGLDRP